MYNVYLHKEKYIHVYINLRGLTLPSGFSSSCGCSCATHIALMQVAGSVAVAVVITDPSLAVSLSWADLMSVGLLSYLLHSTVQPGCGVVFLDPP